MYYKQYTDLFEIFIVEKSIIFYNESLKSTFIAAAFRVLY